MGTDGRDIVLAATFALDGIAGPLARLAEGLAWPGEVVAVPYGRLLPHAADQASPLRRPAAAKVLFLTLSGMGVAGLSELVRLLPLIAESAPVTLIACDEAPGEVAEVLAACGGVPGVELLRAEDIFTRAEIPTPRDPITAEAADLPFTEEGALALVREIARPLDLMLRPPVKLIAVDGDNTLWSGVLGEDGIDGVTLDDGFAALQRRLADLSDAGVILALISKNEESDVRAALAREDFPLSASHFLAIEAGWSAKAARLTSVCERFGVGHNAALFLDDNEVEIAQMRSACPDAMSVTVPTPERVLAFLSDLWPLDRKEATADDLARRRRYKQEASRLDAQAAAPSLSAFFDSLDLQVAVCAVAAQDVARLSQLSFRTNQFSTSLKRMGEEQIAPERVLSVHVSDRFGDYGLVGGVWLQPEGDTLRVPLFMLSCRVLGRGVEQAVLREIAVRAAGLGAATLAFDVVEGPRNGPALSFLKAIGTREGQSVLVSVEEAAGLSFDPEAQGGDKPRGEGAGAEETGARASRSETYEAISHRSFDPRRFTESVSGDAPTRAADLGPLMPPATETERQLHAHWQAVLGTQDVGVTDPFTALGGGSLQLVRLYARLKRDGAGGEAMTLADMFRLTTIRAMAKFLSPETVAAVATDRAAQMRARRQVRRGAR